VTSIVYPETCITESRRPGYNVTHNLAVVTYPKDVDHDS